MPQKSDPTTPGSVATETAETSTSMSDTRSASTLQIPLFQTPAKAPAPRRPVPEPIARKPLPKAGLPGGGMARRGIAARKAVPAGARRRRTEIATPTIKGEITERLSQATARVEIGEAELKFRDEGPEVILRNGDERGAVALACLILENLQRHGGTKVPSKALSDVLDRALVALTQREVMDIEVEAYEVLLWLGRSINPEIEENSTESPERQIKYDPQWELLDLLRLSIDEQFDLELEYYTGGRGEWTTRRVTPHSLEAETYLSAFCHNRQDDRVFRVSRIARAVPVGGLAVVGYTPEG